MIIAICNQKGGVAKTTTTINLASCLAQCRKKVLVVDCDPQYNLTVGVDIEPKGKDVYDLILKEDVSAEEVIQKTNFAFDIIPASLKLANAEVEISNMFMREELLKDKLENIKNQYDYILIDCNPALGLLTLNALVSCDKVLVPIEPGAFNLEGIANLQNLIVKIKKKLNSSIDILGVLLTKVDERTKISKTFKQQLSNIFGDKFFNVVIHDNVKIQDAQMESKPINFFDKHCTGYREYLKLAREVINRNER